MKIEIRNEIREFILEDINLTLARLGVSEKVADCGEWEDKYNNLLRYEIKSAPIHQTPMMFKSLIVEGKMTAITVKEDERYFHLTKENDIIVVTLGYSYKHFDGGSNGCEIGCLIYAVKKRLPESFGDALGHDCREIYVSKLEGITI